MNEKFSDNKIYNDKNFLIWLERKMGRVRLKLNNNSQEKYLKLMHSVNPLVIPRNHKVEEALTAANDGDLEVMNKLLTVLKKPATKIKIICMIIDFQSPAPIRNSFIINESHKISNILWNLNPLLKHKIYHLDT